MNFSSSLELSVQPLFFLKIAFTYKKGYGDMNGTNSQREGVTDIRRRQSSRAYHKKEYVVETK